MEEYAEEKEVVARLRVRFADEAKRSDDWLAERGWDEPQEEPFLCLEAFADRTTDAVRAQNWRLVREHTEFIAREYRIGSAQKAWDAMLMFLTLKT